MCECQKTDGRLFLEELLCYHFPNKDFNIIPRVINEFEGSYSSFFFQISGQPNIIAPLLFSGDFSGTVTYSGYEVKFTVPLTDDEIIILQSWSPPE
ncbi:hypothetical protein [Flavobacterium sp. HNIBRBA15423]|uniref:hypothetical protein n=1 Tax=Flavobacterium sp. HNIBRBA15423 TaxID=3458683 RepID=UPI0040440A84